MIRIARIVTRLNVGGPTHHVSLLSAGLDRRRFQTLVITGRPSPEEGDLTTAVRRRTHVRTLSTLTRALHPWRDAVTWVKMVVLLVRFRPDIVHTHMAKAGALGRSAAWCANAIRRLRGGQPSRIVHTFHGHVLEGYFGPLAEQGFILCERWLARRTDRLVAINQAVAHTLQELRIGSPGQTVVIPLGLSLEPLLTLNGPLASSPRSGGASTWTIGSVGRLVPIKNHRLLLEGLKRLRDDAPALRWRASIVGDGALRASLEQSAEQMGLGGQVKFPGWQMHLDVLYRGLDLVCLTSNNEGTPVALIEALAASKPVVATDVGGVGELLGGHCREGEPFTAAPRGVVVRPQDPEALAQALSWAMAHPQERHEMAAAGHRYVRYAFSADRLLDDMAAFYRELVSEEGEKPCMR